MIFPKSLIGKMCRLIPSYNNPSAPTGQGSVIRRSAKNEKENSLMDFREVSFRSVFRKRHNYACFASFFGTRLGSRDSSSSSNLSSASVNGLFFIFILLAILIALYLMIFFRGKTMSYLRKPGKFQEGSFGRFFQSLNTSIIADTRNPIHTARVA